MSQTTSPSPQIPLITSTSPEKWLGLYQLSIHSCVIEPPQHLLLVLATRISEKKESRGEYGMMRIAAPCMCMQGIAGHNIDVGASFSER